MRQDRSPICAAGRFPHLRSRPLPPFWPPSRCRICAAGRSPHLGRPAGCPDLHSWPLPPLFEILLLAETLCAFYSLARRSGRSRAPRGAAGFIFIFSPDGFGRRFFSSPGVGWIHVDSCRISTRSQNRRPSPQNGTCTIILEANSSMRKRSTRLQNHF